MEKVSYPIMNRSRAIIHLTFAALLSLAFFQSLCRLALADDRSSSRTNGISVLGTYQITGITRTENGQTQDICHDYTDAHRNLQRANELCNTYVWALRTTTQVSLLKAQLMGDPVHPQIANALLSGRCDGEMALADTTATMFTSSQFCRATRARSQAANVETFNFYQTLDPNAPPADRRLSSPNYVTLAMGSGSATDTTIQLARGQANPPVINVTASTTGVFQLMFIPLMQRWKINYTLTRVGN